jgi:Animal haem peroxidase
MADKPYAKRHGFLTRLLERLIVNHFRRVNQTTEWHRLSKWSALLNLLAFRIELREHNLYDTDGDLTKPKPNCPFDPDPPARTMRTASGTQNDLQYPAMGCRESRLGRNVPRSLTAPDLSRLMQPNPLLVSEKLLARRTFKPATSLNLLAGAWIQFQVHDWFGHEKEDLGSGKDLDVPQGNHLFPNGMKIPKTKRDPDRFTELDDKYPAYRNEDPQWWDASQVYGETEEETRDLRTSRVTGQLCPAGKLYLDDNGFLPSDPKTGSTLSGFTDNWWLGLEILHTLFAKEHNAICDHLKKNEPQLSDDEIFEKARLTNCAIMAKIHSVEWTPGILGHPAIQPSLDANWMGLIGHFSNEGLARKIGRFWPDSLLKDMFTGIPLSDTDHHGAPYSLTEEFNAVYRLHPLIPDEVVIKDFNNGTTRHSFKMEEIAFAKARAPFTIAGASMEDAVYSFGTAHPGAITIQNFPNFLRNLTLPADPATGIELRLDLGAVDILRDRERGVPRYNEFRRQLRKEPVTNWNDLAGGDASLAKELEAVYEGKLEDVDTMVGMFCEPLPEGFGFSDTAFRIFILMASRRLKSDRFFTTDYRKEIYTESGLEWVRRAGMKQIILRHHPGLEFAFQNVSNPFAPWRGRQ